MELVDRETSKLLARAGVPARLSPEINELLVTTFQELRQGKTVDGKSLEPLSTAMSTAEAVSVGYAAGLHAYYMQNGAVDAGHLAQSLLGSAIKDSPEDIKKLRYYFEHVLKSRKGEAWTAFYQARHYFD